MKRLFFALWPNEQTRQKVADITNLLDAAAIKKYHPENLHVTLLFLGNVESSVEQQLRQRVNKVIAEPISITFDQFSFWSKPAVLCLTATNIPVMFVRLVDAIRELASDCGINIQQPHNNPHITLARKAKTKPAIDFDPVLLEAQSFVLVQSISTQDGSHYQVLQRWSLQSSVN